MKSTDRETTRLSDKQVHQALEALLKPAQQPTLRVGFERRLARAVTAETNRRRLSRSRRGILWSYWIASAVISAAILWQYQDRLTSGPALWLFGGGLATLAAASLSLSLLAALPVGLMRRIRSLGD